MDPFTTFMLNQGVKGFIGKGPRSTEIRRALQQHGAVYFAAIGGAAALQARSIIKMETIAYEDLGAEAIRRLYVSGMAVYVANDCYGGSIFPEEYDYKE
ncbi:Fumarate hydratase class I, anaerobic [bioreactor metagenome]|uniref:Fumarate hydratase class I, anaerobic n=1 Tax=bioreactor metagenome TaxID=1076179 RepID=A0A645GTW3_9ZZZZ